MILYQKNTKNTNNIKDTKITTTKTDNKISLTINIDNKKYTFINIYNNFNNFNLIKEINLDEEFKSNNIVVLEIYFKNTISLDNLLKYKIKLHEYLNNNKINYNNINNNINNNKNHFCDPRKKNNIDKKMNIIGQKMENIANNPNTNNHSFMIMEAQLEVFGINKENLKCILNAPANTFGNKTNKNYKIKLDYLQKFYNYLKNISKTKTKIINVIKEFLTEKILIKKIIQNKNVNLDFFSI